MTRLLFPLITLIILTGSAPENTGLYDNHPVLRLFSREKKKTPEDTERVSKKEQTGIHLQIWTGTGTIAQQNLFTFSDKTTIDRNRKNLDWWFRLKTVNRPEFAVWQASDRPFTDSLYNWKEPEGLLASGPVINQFDLGNANLFEIEFEEFITGQIPEAAGEMTTFYIRVVALDARGEPDGAPSNTVTAHFGSREK